MPAMPSQIPEPAATIVVREFAAAGCAEFRDFRLQALQTAPGVFASSHEEERLMPPEEWQNMVTGPGSRIFGLYDTDPAPARLVGIAAAFTWREDPSGETALLAMSFVLPEYRGRGLSHLLYDARLKWIRGNPQFRRVVVFHRASNQATGRIAERYGFRPINRALRTWPDGATEDEIVYELKLGK